MLQVSNRCWGFKLERQGPAWEAVESQQESETCQEIPLHFEIGTKAMLILNLSSLCKNSLESRILDLAPKWDRRAGNPGKKIGDNLAEWPGPRQAPTDPLSYAVLEQTFRDVSDEWKALKQGGSWCVLLTQPSPYSSVSRDIQQCTGGLCPFSEAHQ